MSTRAKHVFLFLGILTGLITACLGLETRHSNHLGWALLFAGAGFTTVGSLSLGVLFLQTAATERHSAERRPDRTLWLPCFAALVMSLITPIEYLYLPPVLPRGDHAQDIGLILLAGGLAFYLLSLHQENPWQCTDAVSSRGIFNPPAIFLHAVTCPISASLLLFGLGLGIGFSSWTGLLLSFILLFPGLLYRMGRINQRSYR